MGLPAVVGASASAEVMDVMQKRSQGEGQGHRAVDPPSLPPPLHTHTHSSAGKRRGVELPDLTCLHSRKRLHKAPNQPPSHSAGVCVPSHCAGSQQLQAGKYKAWHRPASLPLSMCASTAEPVSSASLLRCDSDGDCVMLLHGSACGDMTFYNLAAYAVPGVPGRVRARARPRDASFGQQRQQPSQIALAGSTDPSTASCAAIMQGHSAAITCQVEVSYTPPTAAMLQGVSSPRLAAAAATPPKSPRTPSAASSSSSWSSVQLPPARFGRVQLRSVWAGAGPGAEAGADGSRLESPVQMLVTGARDGSVRGWMLHQKHFGRPYFAAHPHTGEMAARQASNLCIYAPHYAPHSSK